MGWPGRNAHQAVFQAQVNLNEGYTWIVELDLEKFFDTVNHDKLMGLLSVKVKDKRTLRLIRAYLRGGIMENGLVSPRREGTPQGSPLSPLLSNIILNELDQMLEERGHRFVRYADDCSTLLGFSFYGSKQGWQIRVASKSLETIKQKIREQTQRNHPIATSDRVNRLEKVTWGWVNYFSIAKAKNQLLRLDEMVRVRLRMIIWKQWKKIHTRIGNLIKLGIPRGKAYEWANSRKSYCRIAHSPILCRALDNAYFTKLKYTGFINYYYWKTEHQKKLF